MTVILHLLELLLEPAREERAGSGRGDYPWRLAQRSGYATLIDSYRRFQRMTHVGVAMMRLANPQVV